MRGEFPEPLGRLLRDKEVVSALLSDLAEEEAQDQIEQAQEKESAA
jgi:hypothetical protein